MSGAYRTVRDEIRHEIEKIKGSRFIAVAAPFRDEAELKRRIERLRAEFSEANHHCYGWRRGQHFRYSDDGEPSGTAGRPILQQIDGHGLERVSITVTRIFGGTKLGSGGLRRAYSAAAREVLDRARIDEVIPTRAVTVTLPYPLTGALQAVTTARALEARDSSFGEQVGHTFDVAVDDVDAFVAEVHERTAGRAAVTVGPD